MIGEHQVHSTIFDAEFQQPVYRCILRALSYPGTLCVLPRGELPVATGFPVHVVLSALVDEIVSLYSDSQEGTADLVSQAFVRASGVSTADVQSADFIVASGQTFSLGNQTPICGTLYRPDASATIILHCDALATAPSGSATSGSATSCSAPAGSATLFEITGPGVQSTNRFAASGLVREWMDARDGWCARYPMGVDLLLLDRHNMVGLPRTASIRIVTR